MNPNYVYTAKTNECNISSLELDSKMFNSDSVTGKTYAEKRRSENSSTNNSKRPRLNETYKSTNSRTLSAEELLKKSRIRLTDLYNEKQIERMRSMSKEEKKKYQCLSHAAHIFTRRKIARIRFPYANKYNCFRFGHASRTCKEGMNEFINSLNCDNSFKNNKSTKDRSPFDATKLDQDTIKNLFQIDTAFLVDSAATHHAVSDESFLQDFQK